MQNIIRFGQIKGINQMSYLYLYTNWRRADGSDECVIGGRFDYVRILYELSRRNLEQISNVGMELHTIDQNVHLTTTVEINTWLHCMCGAKLWKLTLGYTVTCTARRNDTPSPAEMSTGCVGVEWKSICYIIMVIVFRLLKQNIRCCTSNIREPQIHI
jgi:hypothetical protein